MIRPTFAAVARLLSLSPRERAGGRGYKGKTSRSPDPLTPTPFLKGRVALKRPFAIGEGRFRPAPEAKKQLHHPLEAVRESELQGLARLAGRLLAVPGLRVPGSHPHLSRPGGGSEFLDFRELQPGDSPRDLDWRASARSGRPQVRRYRDERAADWMLCLDRSASMGVGDGRKWALAVQLAAALAYLLLHQDHRVGLILFSDGVDDLCRPARGRSAYGALLRLLRRAAPPRAGGASRLGACLPHVRPGARVLVIGDFLAPDAMAADLAALARLGEQVQALQILDPADTAVATEGRAGLEDVESGLCLPVHLDQGARQRAERGLQALVAGLRQHCRHHRIAFTGCRTGTPWKQVLVDHLRTPEGHRA